jgi:hypothetical protein
LKAPSVEIAGRDPNSLARTAVVRVNGNTYQTPELALDFPTRNAASAEVLAQPEFERRSTVIEVYRTLSIDRVNDCVSEGTKSTEATRKLSSEIGLALRRASELGGIPMLVLALTDNNRNPLNTLPPKREMNFVMDLLWRPENKVIVPPIVGVLTRPAQYTAIIDALKIREETVQERFVMPVIPSTYRSVTQEIIDRYWDAGARMFAADLQGRGFSANAPSITLIQRTLGRNARKAKEGFVLHALNSRERIGVRDSARTNWLIGTAFGFDTVGGNHIPPKGFSPVVDPHEEVGRVSLLQARDYGYYPIRELLERKTKKHEIETDTFPFASVDLETLAKSSDTESVRLAAKEHNLVKVLRETGKFRAQLARGHFETYVRQKGRVATDYDQAREVVSELRVKTLE